MPNLIGWTRLITLVSGGTAVVLAGLYLLLSATPLADLFPGILSYVAAALLSGAGYSALLGAAYHPAGRLPSISIGLVYGLVNWLIFGIIVIPTLAGQSPQWSIDQAAAQFSLLSFFLIHGLLLTAAIHALHALGWLARAPATPPPVSAMQPGIS